MNGIREIEETTVANLDGQRVPVSNVWDRDYTLPDGTGTHGMTAQIYVNEQPVIVGAGCVFTAGPSTWEVVEVVKRGDIGFVRVKKQ